MSRETTNKKPKARSTDSDTLFLRAIPSKVKKNFKAACARKDETMQDALIALMESYIAA